MVIVGLIYVLLCIKALELTNVTRAIVWRCSRVKVFIGVVWTCVMCATVHQSNSRRSSARLTHTG